jgi:cytochrome c oxidase assembly protein subunit 15
MSRSVNNNWLTRFALATAVATLMLIGLGGLVTSHEAGLSVPDWPTSYGYNMFLLPLSKWWRVGGAFFEHGHRLMASAVGLLTAILAIWLWIKEPRAWMRWLGVIAFFAVVLQGVLGGLRVVLLKDEIGIFHAALAQLFFVLLCAITLYSSRWWRNMLVTRKPVADTAGLRTLLLLTTVLVFAQLTLGATMRHQHAGLAIPDFPLAYHKVWPSLDADSIAAYNAQRVDMAGERPITAFQIVLQMAHRFVALAIFCLVIFSARSVRRNLGADHPLAKLSLAWVGLVVVQVILGAATIWSNKAADIATAHVVTGALTLANGALLTIISFRVLIPARAEAPAASEPTSSSFSPGKPAASSAK